MTDDASYHGLAMLVLAMAVPALAVPFNPQEVAMVVENYIVDTDATVIGLLDHDAGNTHGDTTFTYHSSLIGPPDSALPGVPMGSRTEWQAWRGATLASISGDDYVIDYAGYMKDTRTSASDDPTYDIRWESTWWKNNPSKTGTPYAEGSGGFEFDDPDLDFSIEVDPSSPSNVTLGGSASTTLWGVVGVSISGSKNFGTGVLTASAGVSVDVPLVSDIFGSLASGEFELTYDQDTGRYRSKIKGEALFGLLSDEKTVNRGRVVTPAKKDEPPPPDPPDPDPPRRPVLTGRRNTVETHGGLGGAPPTTPGYIVPPWTHPTPVLTPNPYDPFGELAQIAAQSDPSLHYDYPSVAVNDFGDIVIGFSASDDDTPVASYAVWGKVDGAGVPSFDTPFLLKPGSGSYARYDRVGRNRWGDYSATVVDPANESNFWTFQEFVNGTDNWGVQITQIIQAHQSHRHPPGQPHGRRQLRLRPPARDLRPGLPAGRPHAPGAAGHGPGGPGDAPPQAAGAADGVRQRTAEARWLVPCFQVRRASKVARPADAPPCGSRTLHREHATGCIGKWDVSGRRRRPGMMPNDQGFDYYFGTWGANDRGRVRLVRNRQPLETTKDMASLTGRYTDEAIAFLRKHQDGPFFLYVAHTMAHVVIDASERFKGKSKGDLYGDVIEEIDWNVGRLIDTLKQLGLERNTIVVFTSDNGPWCQREAHYRKTHGGHLATGSPGPLRGHKGSNWEGGVRVPCVVWGPGRVPGGRESAGIAATIDLLPTFASLAGGPLPEYQIDGIDQSALFTKATTRSARDRHFYYRGGKLQAVRRERWKLFVRQRKKGRAFSDLPPDSPQLRLYDLENDIGETTNVAEEHPDAVRDLLKLADWAVKHVRPVEGLD